MSQSYRDGNFWSMEKLPLWILTARVARSIIAAMTTRYKAPVAPRHYIKEWLVALEVNQQELADLMETDKSNVARWLSEPRRVNLDVLQGISEALKLRFPILSDPGNLLRPPEKALAMGQLEAAAATIAGRSTPAEPAPKPKRRH